MSSLKDRYSLNAETLQNENNDLKATLSLVRQDVLRLQSEILILSEKANSLEIQEKIIEEVCEDDTIEEINPIDALERIKIYLLENLSDLSTDSLKSVFDEISKKKTNMEIANDKQKKYITKLASILKFIVDYTKKENSLIELLALVDDNSSSEELRDTINNIKLNDITVRPTSARKNFDTDNTPEKEVYTQLVQVLRNLHDSVLNDRLF